MARSPKVIPRFGCGDCPRFETESLTELQAHMAAHLEGDVVDVEAIETETEYLLVVEGVTSGRPWRNSSTFRGAETADRRMNEFQRRIGDGYPLMSHQPTIVYAELLTREVTAWEVSRRTEGHGPIVDDWLAGPREPMRELLRRLQKAHRDLDAAEAAVAKWVKYTDGAALEACQLASLAELTPDELADENSDWVQL